MRTGKTMWKITVVLLAIAALFFVVCTTNAPTQPDAWGQTITISLVEKNNTQTNYTGRDLDLIIEFEDSIQVKLGTNFNIHSLRAQIYHTTEIITNAKVLSLTVPLYWENIIGLPIDSNQVGMKPYDTIYVQAGLGKSNVVRVNIYNLPPKITGLTVGDSIYAVPPHIIDVLSYTYFISDNTDSIVNFALSVIDPDDSYNISWGIYANEYVQEIEKYLTYTITNAKYYVRNGNIRDIVSTIINDGDKQIHVKVNMIRLDGNDVIIDSITYNGIINDTSFLDTSIDKHYFNVITMDSTATIRAFPHITGGSGRWSAKKGLITTNLTLDSSGCAITYICTLSTIGDTITSDMTLMIDSLRFVYTNKFGDDSTEKILIINKRPANRNPVIDSIFIASTKYTSNYSHLVAAGTTIPMEAFAHDPEGGVPGGTVTYTWQGILTGSLFNSTGDTTSYTAAFATYTDTLFLIVADSLAFKDTQMITLPCNQAPIIDTILIDTIKYTSGFQHVVNAKDTIVLKGISHDPESSFVKYTWQGTSTGKLSSIIGDSITYIAASGVYSDTLYLVVTDSVGFSDIQLFILMCNNLPVIDSIRVSDTLFIPVSAGDTVFYTDTFSAPDTFDLTINAHEMDTALSDVITSYLWIYKNANLVATTSTAPTFTYISADSTYNDTVRVRVTDRYNSINRRKVIITFKK